MCFSSLGLVQLKFEIMSIQNKRLVIILLSVSILLLLPLIVMQFSTKVNWNSFDFLVWGVLLIATGGAMELGLRTVKTTKNRIAVVLTIVTVFLLVWAELAVGIFGTPFSGS